MKQILFHLPFLHIPVYGYGVMMVLGFFLGLELAKFLARRSGIDPETMANAALIALVTGVIGARASHVLENWSEYTDPAFSLGHNLLNMVNIRSGGLTYYGGFLLAFPCTVAYGIYKKAPVRIGMDIIAPCLMIGLGFGRIGCLLNGCCYGAETEAAWKIDFPYLSNAYIDEFRDNRLKQPVPKDLLEPGTPLATYVERTGASQLQEPLPAELAAVVQNGGKLLKSREEVDRDPALRAVAANQHSNGLHPAQIYSTLTAWLIAALLIAYFTLPHVPGRVFALMLIIEGIGRFVLELLRAEPPVWGSMSLSMILGVGLTILGVVLWFVFGAIASRRGEISGPRISNPRVAAA